MSSQEDGGFEEVAQTTDVKKKLGAGRKVAPTPLPKGKKGDMFDSSGEIKEKAQ